MDTDVSLNVEELSAAWEEVQRRYGRDFRLRQVMLSVPRGNGRSPWPPPPDPLAVVREVAARHCTSGSAR